MRISVRLLLLFLLVAVLPLALYSYFALRQSEAMLQTESLGMVSGLADKKIMQVKSYLAERMHDARTLAGSKATAQGMEALAQAYLRDRPGSTAYQQVARQFEREFVVTFDGALAFYDVFLITPQGEVVYTYKREADFATNLIDGPYRDSALAEVFRQARMTLGSSLSSFESYSPSKQPAAFIAVPILREGRFIGVLALQLSIERIYEVAGDRLGLGQTGETVLARRIDPQHAMYIAPLARQDELDLMRPRAFEKVPFIMRQALSGAAGSGVSKDYRGIEVVAAWRYLPEMDWGMVVKMDADEVFARVVQQRLLSLEALAVLLLCAGAAAYYFGRQISRPLGRLALSADKVASGNLAERADESAPGELGLFAQAFNRMTSDLQELYATLENRVEERTRELHATNEQLQEEIIEREHTEAALRSNQVELQHNQDLLNEAQHMGKLGSWELDLASGELRWSDEIYRMFELDPQRFSPSYENFLSVIHPEDRDRVNQAYTLSLQDRLPYDIEHRLLLPDGRVKWVREHCTSYFDDAGSPLRSVGAVQDITAQKQSEENLRIAAVAFETHEGIMVTDTQATILRVNRAFTEITGFSAEEVIGRNPRILSSGRHDQAFYAAMWEQLREQGTWSGEIWDRRKNGEIYPKWLTITAVKNAAGEVSEFVAIFSDITARKRAEEEIRNLAFYDALTGLPNRRMLLDRFQLALSLSARTHHCGALMFLDMDKFKTLNDTLGHDYGDLMLIEVGRRIQACVRDTDTVARLGGDEFVVLLEEVGTHMQDASQKVALIAEKIRLALAAPYLIKLHEFHSSPSMGVTLYQGSSQSVDALMKQADLAMYQAKDSGRNVVRFFDPLMQQAVEARSQIELDLRGALPGQQLQLYYQIQVDGENRAVGAEALIRWMHPKRGMIPPVQFIPVAEESSLIMAIGDWVIDTACRQLAAWSRDEELRYLQLAINVSAQQFRLHDFVGRLQETIVKYDIVPERLKLELTESVVLEDIADVVAKMHALKALGVKISLDDFGTGYSSLFYLKQLPLDQIKIDRSFVRDITTDPNDAVMVKTIIDMAQNFRLNVIAEGVETEAQLAFLNQNGCMAYQGYLFGRPVPLAEFEAAVRKMN